MHPSRLAISIGSVLGPSYEVEWTGQALHYRAFESDDAGATADLEVMPEPASWDAFWGVLDDIGVWGWDVRYEDPHAIDGTGWFVEIEWRDRRLASSGMNAYPPDGRAPGDPGPAFLGLCAAVSVLVDGRPFR